MLKIVQNPPCWKCPLSEKHCSSYGNCGEKQFGAKSYINAKFYYAKLVSELPPYFFSKTLIYAGPWSQKHCQKLETRILRFIMWLLK